MKANKYGAVAILLFISIIVLMMYIEKDRYSEVTEDMIHEVSNIENLEILDYKIVNDGDKHFAYIFYEQLNKIGAYLVVVKNGKLMYNTDLIIGSDNKLKVQSLGIRSGYPYEVIRIHDEEILNSGRVLLFSFGNKKQHRLEVHRDKKDYLIVGDYGEADASSSSLFILDKDDQVIYQEGEL